MTGRNRKRVLKSAFTHISNEEKVKILEPDVEIKNNMFPSELTVSDDDVDPNTHFSNLVSATAKKLLAGTDGIFVHQSIIDDGENQAMTPPVSDEHCVDIVDASSDDSEDTSKDKDEDKAEDIKDSKPEDDKSSEDDKPEDKEKEVSAEDIPDEAVSNDEISSAYDDVDSVDVGSEPLEADDSVELPEADAPQQELEVEDTIDLLDVDNIDDNDIEDLEFVTSGSKVHAIKSNRIIATLTKKNAVKAGTQDKYQTDAFADAVVFECNKVGLRNGLKSCGFSLASIKTSSDKALSAKLTDSAKQLKASYDKKQAKYLKSWEQCLALACEGINRNMFKEYTNPVRAELVASLNSVGITNASKVVRSIFASSGSEMMQQIVALATKLQAMPEDVRDNIAEQLDMTTEPEDEDYLGDTIVESAEDEDDEYIDDISTVEAALSNPLRKAKRIKASVDQPFTGIKNLSFNIY